LRSATGKVAYKKSQNECGKTSQNATAGSDRR